jgi:hypothetical protein
MRYAAQRSIELQDNFPADGNIYMPDIMDKGGSMVKALREWERRRGMVFTFKGKMLGTKKKEEEVQETPKVLPKPADTIRVPRDKDRPKSEVSAERRRKLNEYNRKYRERNREKCLAAVRRSKERAKALSGVRDSAS